MANQSLKLATQPERSYIPPNPYGDPALSEEGGELARRIAENAYLKAEQRGFEPGHEMDDWLSAEAEIRAALAGDSG